MGRPVPRVRYSRDIQGLQPWLGEPRGLEQSFFGQKILRVCNFPRGSVFQMTGKVGGKLPKAERDFLQRRNGKLPAPRAGPEKNSTSRSHFQGRPASNPHRASSTSKRKSAKNAWTFSRIRIDFFSREALLRGSFSDAEDEIFPEGIQGNLHAAHGKKQETTRIKKTFWEKREGASAGFAGGPAWRDEKVSRCPEHFGKVTGARPGPPPHVLESRPSFNRLLENPGQVTGRKSGAEKRCARKGKNPTQQIFSWEGDDA